MRASAWALGLGLLCLTAVALQATMRPPSLGVRVWGLPDLPPGGSAGLRLAVFDPDRLAYVPGPAARITLAAAGRERLLFAEAAEPDSVALAVGFDVPDLPAGPARLLLEVGAITGADEVILRLDVPVRLGPPSAIPRLVDASRSLAPFDDGTREPYPEAARVRAYPRSGAVVPSLPNEIVTWHRVPGTRLLLPAGAAPVDAAGLSVVRFVPAPPAPPGRLRFDGDDVILLETVPAQMVFTRPEATLVQPGEQIELTVETLRRDGRLAFDIWHDDGLAACRTVDIEPSPTGLGRARLELHTSDDILGLITVGVARSFFGPGRAAAHRTFFVAPGGTDSQLAGLVAALEARGGSDPLIAHARSLLDELPGDASRQRLAAALASLVEPPWVSAPLLLDQSPGQASADAARRAATLRAVFWGYGALGCLAIVGVLVLIVRQRRRMRRALSRWQEEGAPDEDEGVAMLSGGTWLAWLYLAAIIAFALISVALLLRRFRW